MSESACAVCGATNITPGNMCEACHASPEWLDLFRASRMTLEQATALHEQHLLNASEYRRLDEIVVAMQRRWSQQMGQHLQPPSDTGLPQPLHCRKCGRLARADQKFCATCGGPTGTRTHRLRYMDYASKLITQNLVGEMAAGDFQRCNEALRATTATFEAELTGEAEAQPPSGAGAPDAQGRRNFVEMLLDPQSIRWLLSSGAVLLAVGLVIFLSSLGVFKNVAVVASTMGFGTLATLAGGVAVIRLTRHSLAGKAMALLGCLVMPLNLWFYNAHRLVTLDGHLWLAATVCCGIYAVAAFVLEDPIFVYVLFGGITMTGMLVLADLHRLAEISSPASLLVALGLISLHAERAFADDDGPFSRKRFGPACFGAAHALIGVGLLLVLGAQVAQWTLALGLGPDRFTSLTINSIVSLALVLAGGYGYLYSSLVVRRSRSDAYAATICLLWAEMLGMQLGHVTHHLAALMSTLALTSLVMNFRVSLRPARAGDQQHPLARPLPLLAIGLYAVALAIALLPQVGSLFPNVIVHFRLAATWAYVGAIALTAVCGRIAAMLNAERRHRLSVAYLVATALATFIGTASVLTLLGMHAWPVMATALMVVPILYLLAARLHADGPAKQSLPTIAVAAVVVLIFGGLIAGGTRWVNPIPGQTEDLWLACFALESIGFFVIAAANGRGSYNVYFAGALICGLLNQLLGFWGVSPQSYSIGIALTGMTALIGHRFVGVKTRGKDDPALALFVTANSLISLPMAGMILMTLSRLAAGHVDGSMLWTPAALSVIALIAATVVPAGGVRRWYFALTIIQVATGLMTLSQYSTLGLPRKLELLSVLAGLVLLVVGYGRWYRTQNGNSDGVGSCLLFGSLLAGLPPGVFAVINRFAYEVLFVDELTLVTIAVLMFLTGAMCRLRATTLVGGGLLICHLLTLVVFAGMKAQLAVGAYVAIGGAALFVTGLLLSIHRERLLAMPQQIRQRQGLFSVLAWR